MILERALRALASPSGGAAWPKATRVNPRSQGVIPMSFKRKKIFVTNGLTNGRTDRRDGRNSYLDYLYMNFTLNFNL